MLYGAFPIATDLGDTKSIIDILEKPFQKIPSAEEIATINL